MSASSSVIPAQPTQARDWPCICVAAQIATIAIAARQLRPIPMPGVYGGQGFTVGVMLDSPSAQPSCTLFV